MVNYQTFSDELAIVLFILINRKTGKYFYVLTRNNNFTC